MADSPAKTTHKRRPRSGTLQRIEADPNHHLVGSFRPQTPSSDGDSISGQPAHMNGNATPIDSAFSTESRGFWNDLKTLRWAVVPSSAFRLLLIPLVPWALLELLRPLLPGDFSNPFALLIFISHRVPESSAEDPRYQKGWHDLAFIAYYIVVWSFVRQIITLRLSRPVARYFRLKKEEKILRLGEQMYSILYAGLNGIWGIRIMSQLPTWWYRTEYLWIGYPHWDMIPELKQYYLMQAAFWCQQTLVLVLKLEKPRKDQFEMAVHHAVTLYLIGWSYIINLTIIGNAIFVSMDIPEMFLCLSRFFNYIRWEKPRVTIFVTFIAIWTYFRHYLNFKILWSVLFELDLIPEHTMVFSPKDGWWMVWWMRYMVFLPILALQCLQLFWYVLIWRVAYRVLSDTRVAQADVLSDDEADDEPDGTQEKEE